MKTNLKAVKEQALLLLNLDVSESDLDETFFLFIPHPFINNLFMPIKKEDGEFDLVNIFASEENLSKVREYFRERIENSKNIWHMYMIMNKPYRALFFKLIEEFLSKKDYNEFLRSVWMDSENPNQDPNVSVRKWVYYFKHADRNLLMNSEERKFYNSLPEQVEVYRGVAKNRNPKGLSWTNDWETAEWFAKRWSNPNAYVLKGVCNKSDILAYLNGRGEKELVIDPKKISSVEKIFL